MDSVYDRKGRYLCCLPYYYNTSRDGRNETELTDLRAESVCALAAWDDGINYGRVPS